MPKQKHPDYLQQALNENWSLKKFVDFYQDIYFKKKYLPKKCNELKVCGCPGIKCEDCKKYHK